MTYNNKKAVAENYGSKKTMLKAKFFKMAYLLYALSARLSISFIQSPSNKHEAE